MTLDINTNAAKRRKMKRRQSVFEFKPEDIYFMQKMLKKGELEKADRDQLVSIYRERVNPKYADDLCDGCHAVTKQAFRRMIRIMCDSLGIKENQFRAYRFAGVIIEETKEPEQESTGFFSKLFKTK